MKTLFFCALKHFFLQKSGFNIHGFFHSSSNFVNLENDDHDEIEAHYIPLKKPKQSELEEALTLMEKWSLFGENGLEIRKKLNMIRHQKHYTDSKKQCSIKDFFES